MPTRENITISARVNKLLWIALRHKALDERRTVSAVLNRAIRREVQDELERANHVDE